MMVEGKKGGRVHEGERAFYIFRVDSFSLR